MAERGESKKHPASEMQRRRAREAGHFPRSSELAPALLWLFGLGVLQWMVPKLVESYSHRLRESLTWHPSAGTHLPMLDLTQSLWGAAWIVLPVLLAILLAACVAGFAQAGFRWMPQRLFAKFSEGGLGTSGLAFFSVESTVGSLLGCLKSAVVVAVVGRALWLEKAEILNWSGLELSLATAAAWRLLLGVSWQVGFAWLCFAAVDYGWQRWRFEQRLRMSDTELRDELKEAQGNPQVRSQRRRFYADRL